jgi:hypothetical protein
VSVGESLGRRAASIAGKTKARVVEASGYQTRPAKSECRGA